MYRYAADWLLADAKRCGSTLVGLFKLNPVDP